MMVLGVQGLLGSFLMPDGKQQMEKLVSGPCLLCQRLSVREAAHTVVQGDDVQAVEQLPLVLMDPLHLHVEHGVGVDLHLVLLFKKGGELHLVLL